MNRCRDCRLELPPLKVRCPDCAAASVRDGEPPVGERALRRLRGLDAVESRRRYAQLAAVYEYLGPRQKRIVEACVESAKDRVESARRARSDERETRARDLAAAAHREHVVKSLVDWSDPEQRRAYWRRAFYRSRLTG